MTPMSGYLASQRFQALNLDSDERLFNLMNYIRSNPMIVQQVLRYIHVTSMDRDKTEYISISYGDKLARKGKPGIRSRLGIQII